MMSEENQPLLACIDGDESLTTKSLIVTKSSSNRLAITLSDVVEEREVDFVSAVFVATFDTKSGNIIEWSFPNNLDSQLEFLEFKALPSGAHTVDSDFIYFRCKNLFGLGCYARMRLNCEVERGARMKTVGILTPNYTTLFRHMQFLENQVQLQLQNCGDYDGLEEFLKDHQEAYPMSVNTDQPLITSKYLNHDTKLPIMKITHPAGCFSQFINFFGPSIFVLWKLVLLRKRILFFSPPPIGVVCYRVYCACCLGKITIEGVENNGDVDSIRPYFYINVADIDVISKQSTYIACTTEKVFEEKPQLFDVYVDNQRVTTKDQHLSHSNLMKVNKYDMEKYTNLINHKNDLQHQRITAKNDELPSEESFYQSYFTQQNNEIFQTLLDISCSNERTITNEHMRAMGLDPCSDRSFIMDLLELYAIDALLVADNPCCPY